MRKSISFKVIPVCYQDAKGYDEAETDFLLEVDNWDDFHYKTTYHLHASRKLTSGKTLYLGSINIMRIGQQEGESDLLRKIFHETANIFTELPDDFISVSFSQELYQGVSKLLQTSEERKMFVDHLRLVMGTDSALFEKVKDDKCFNTSILRDSTMDSFALKKGKQYLFENGVFYDLEKQTITVKYVKSADPITFEFKGPQELERIKDIPSGVIAFIGHNGCGKSTLLYQLVRLLYATPAERYRMKDSITVAPNDVGISKLLMFAYSAFDNFLLPGVTVASYRLMAEGVDSRTGRFVYCGVRDVKKEIDDIVNKQIEKNKENEKDTDNNTVIADKSRMVHIVLKPIERLADEFKDALGIINGTGSKRQIWNDMMERCKELIPTLYQDISQFNQVFVVSEDCAKNYMKLSTGVKFFLHTMSHIHAYTEDNSMLLFDEPENHLHPPMLSFMMSEIRRAIRETHSVMLIATHSPVILQEMFAKNVYVVSRVGDHITFNHPETETYGENFGYINNLVFRLNSDISRFHTVFDELYQEWECAKLDNFEKVIEVFKYKLGCEELSSQMVAYLASLYYENKD